jgi:hypothetical protein
MKTKSTNVLVQNKNILFIALAVAFLLLLLLVVMQFSDEFDWGVFDFVIVGALLFGMGLVYELISRKTGATVYRAAVGIAIGTALLITWINLAVGIIGSEDNPVNLLFFGVIPVLITGALIARLQPRGMARALFATAVAQAIAPIFALIIGRPQIATVDDLVGVLMIFALNTFFVALWVGSALLFRRASATGTNQD